MNQSIRDRFPLHLLIGSEDYTFLLSDNWTASNADPGGHEMASFSFSKDLPQILRGYPVKLDCGTQVLWEGRVKEPQRSLGAKTLIQCEGYVGKLKDQELSMVFVDRDLTRWGSPSIERSLQLAEADYTQGSSSTAAGPEGLPAILQEFTGAWTPPWKPVIESWYDIGPENLIEKIYYALTSNSQVEAASGFEEHLFTSLKAAYPGSEKEATANLHPSASGLFVPGKKYRYAFAQLFYPETPAGNAGEAFQAIWKSLAVYGNHGLTLRGSAPYGLYTSDVVKWVVSQLEGIQEGVIPEAAFYTVPHAAYYAPTEAQQMMADMAKLVAYHWGVWESLTYLTGNPEPRLDFRPYPGDGEPTAWCWRQECETLDIREDLSSQYNVAQVNYSEVSGEEGAVKVEIPNPILQEAGIKNRVISLSLGTSTPAGAEEYGRIALKLLQEQARIVGSAEIAEPIHRMRGDEFPPWLLKSGIDRLRVPDLPSYDVWGKYSELPITRVETSGSATGIKTSVEFGQGRNLLEALTSELQQAAVLGGQGA